MQLTEPRSTQAPALWKSRLGWFSIGPLAGIIIMLTLLLLGISSYNRQHDGRIFTGVYVGDHDLSRLTLDETQVLLSQSAELSERGSITFFNPVSNQSWTYTHEELGLALDVETTAQAAYAIGRSGVDRNADLRAQFASWYYGTSIQPIYVLNESEIFSAIDTLANEINTPTLDAAIKLEGDDVRFEAGQLGLTLDKAHTYEQMTQVINEMNSGQVELLVHQSKPVIFDAGEASQDIANILGSPINFYIQNPIDGDDLIRTSLSTNLLREWLRVRTITDEQGQATYDIFIDEVALRGWILQLAPSIARDPENARFYFDDPTGELVLVEPHISGRELDIDGTVARFMEQVDTSNRSVALAVLEIVPDVHSGVTAQELGITELIAERTTWFSDSSNNRKHNIARSASNFYGIVVAPGEQFSFNRYLGDVSEEEGYETGLIILGGQTIEGVGGGVCQVSTTLFQTAFWAGLDLGQRLEHGYRVSYYDDGEGPGMDATVYSPLVDFTFTNNTPHYLLMENYYNEQFESLTFKLYSTNIGRVVEKAGPLFENVQEPPADEWVFNPELDPNTIRQVEYAAEGARVTVDRVVYNFEGEVRDQDTLVSNYIPWNNVYEYGDGIDPENLPYNWQDLIVEDA